MNLYLPLIIVILVGNYILGLITDYLNIRHLETDLPGEFDGYYDSEKYKKSQTYLKENTIFKFIIDTVFILITLAFILLDGFNWVDGFARSFNLGPILTGLIFAGAILMANQIIHIPFDAYDTFVIEEKYGFNKTTIKTFIADILKGWLIGLIIGVIIFSIILWLFGVAGSLAWLYCWIAVTLFLIFILFISPVMIMPLFNKFTPLEDGELKTAIENYAQSEKFRMKGVFKMDGSKRSTKTNAFLTGLGRFRRIVLFDTLIARHTTDELVSVIAHEMGHYRKRHILKSLILSILTSGLMFYLLSLFINNQGLFDAFKMEKTSIYASLFFFGFLYTPINLAISIFGNVFSRKHEYEADRYAVVTYKKPEAMINALKKLSVDNLSNLTPHPLKVFLLYTHPPVLSRINAVRSGLQ
ncbi:MAG: M48 family metallopeptidase [Planctomycetes bacterium]|nr:M48 family metallopeptidase [Planctomycetota bacterium]